MCYSSHGLGSHHLCVATWLKYQLPHGVLNQTASSFNLSAHSAHRGQIIQTVKYADDPVLMTKEETVLKGMIDKLTETGRYYGMEINVKKTKVMRISRQLSPITNTINQKQRESELF